MWVIVCSAVITKFSRYNESSDSDESDTTDTSDSESNSTDDGGRLASPRSVSPTRASPNDELSTNKCNNNSGAASASIDEQSSTQQLIDAETLKLTEQTDLPTDKARSRHSSALHESKCSSSSSVGTPPSPIHTPLQLESTVPSSLPPHEHRKGVATHRHGVQVTARKSPFRNYESSPSGSGRADIRGEKLSLQTLNSSRSHLVEYYSSTLDLKPQLASLNEQLSPHRRPMVASGDEKYRLRSRSHERSSDGKHVSRSYASERQPPSPLRFKKDDITDRDRHSSGPDNVPQSRSCSRSPSLGRSSHQQKLRPTEKDSRRLQRSRSSSRSFRRSSSKSRSRSRGRFVGHSAVQSTSRSQLPAERSPYQRHTRSGSASRTDEPFVRDLDSEVARRTPSKSPSQYRPADSYKDAPQRQTSCSSPKERTFQASGSQDVDCHKRIESSPHRRSFSRSPDNQTRRTIPKSLSRRKIVESPLSSSQSSSRHGSPIPGLSEEKSPRRRLSPGKGEKKRPNGDRTNSDKDRLGDAVVKPRGSMSRRLQPEVGDRLSPPRSSVVKHNLTSRKRSPDNRPSVQTGRVRDRLGRSHQRTNEVTRSHVRKRYSPSLQESASSKRKTSSQYDVERHFLDRPKEYLPVSSAAKPVVKVKVHSSRQDESHSKSRQNITSIPAEHQKMSTDKSEDSSVVEKLKKLAELDKIIHENEDAASKSRDKSSRQEHSHLQKVQTLLAKNVSASDEPENTGARKALSLKRPAARATAVLEARKRRFQQTEYADSRSVCIRSETESFAKVRRQLSPMQHDKSKQLSREEAVTADVNDAQDKAEESGAEKTSGKTTMDVSVSDISDASSADSSVSLEDISEDEMPRTRDKHFVERSDFSSSPRPPADGPEVRKQQGNDNENITSSKTPAVSSIVRPVKVDTAVPKTRRSVQAVTQRIQLATDAQSSVDDASTADDDIAVTTAVQNVNKG